MWPQNRLHRCAAANLSIAVAIEGQTQTLVRIKKKNERNMEDSGEKLAKSNRGSGVSMPINRNHGQGGRNFPMEKGFGPDLQYMQGGYNPYMMHHHPILVNPPPMPTVCMTTWRIHFSICVISTIVPLWNSTITDGHALSTSDSQLQKRTIN